MTRWLRAIASLVVLLVWPAAAISQSAQQPKLPRVKDLTIAQADLKGYQSLLRQYCAGDATALDKLLAFDREALLDGVTVINTGLDDTRPWPLGDIKSAVLMHTDAVLLLLRQSDNEDALRLQLDAAGRVLVRGADPLIDPHPETLKRNNEIRAFASRWYVATSRLLRDRTRFEATRVLLGWGRQRVLADPAILYESGVMEEFIATHPSRKIGRELAGHMAFSYGDSIANDLLKDHGDQLAAAERWLRESMTRDASRLDTQLHLGRVLMLLGRDDDAVGILDKVASGSVEHAYLAHMFRGAIEERRGALAAARAAYRRAAELRPGAQAASVALSQVLQRQGEGDQSRALLDELLGHAPVADDAWWLYFFEPTPVVLARVEALFTEISR